MTCEVPAYRRPLSGCAPAVLRALVCSGPREIQPGQGAGALAGWECKGPPAALHCNSIPSVDNADCYEPNRPTSTPKKGRPTLSPCLQPSATNAKPALLSTTQSAQPQAGVNTPSSCAHLMPRLHHALGQELAKGAKADDANLQPCLLGTPGAAAWAAGREHW